MIAVMSLVIVLFASILGGIGPIYLKQGAQKLRKDIKSILNIQLWTGIILYASGVLMYTFALRGAELTTLYPVVSLSYVWAALFSMKLMGEKMNKNKWSGIILIILGTVLVSLAS